MCKLFYILDIKIIKITISKIVSKINYISNNSWGKSENILGFLFHDIIEGATWKISRLEGWEKLFTI
jgi:hypothetical protein